MVALGPSVAASPGSRSWSPSGWPLRWKVAAILVLPVVLAMTFGAIRIENELTQASRFTVAATEAEFIDPAVALVDATSELGYLAAAGSDVSEALSSFDTAVATFTDAQQAGDRSVEVTADLTAALASAQQLRDLASAPNPSRAELAQLVRDVTTQVGAAVGTTMRDVDDRDVRDLADGLVLGLVAQSSLAIERTLIESPDFVDNVALRLQVAVALGNETGALDELVRQLPAVVGSDEENLRDGINERIDAYSAIGPTSVTSAAFVESGRTSADLYTQLTTGLGERLSTALHDRAVALRSAALRDTAIILGAVLLALVFALAVAKSLVRSITRLRHGALQVARQKLPDEIERLRSSESVPEIEAMPVHTTEEIGQLARAIDDIHLQALRLAGEHGERLRIGDMFETLSRRSRSLVEEQLALIDTLERDEEDPVRLEHLFRLDHLTTRMRRNGDNLLVLADTSDRRGRLEPVALADVLRAGMSEVEDYRRVQVVSAVEGSLTGVAAADVAHMIAELVDNALRYSPPDSVVSVMVARAVDAGYLIEIVDRGLGMSEDELRSINDRLASGGEVTAETARRMGLFVVGRLARRHGATVRLRSTDARTVKSGVTASVHVPGALIAVPGDVDYVGEARSRVPAHSVAQPPARQAPQSVRLGPAQVAASPAPVPVGSAQPASASAGHAEHEIADRSPHSVAPLLPRRSPGASGVSSEMPGASAPVPPAGDVSTGSRVTPTNTSAFFNARNGDGTGPRPKWPPAQFPQPRTAPPPPGASPRPEPGSARLEPAPDQPPIFRRLSSEWLADPTKAGDRTQPWVSTGDAGWDAARQAGDATVERRTQAGLPMRNRGARLVPGGLQPNTAGDNTSVRSPEAIRANISRQFAGVRNGRARIEQGGPGNDGRHSVRESDD